jgi:tRNA pseudouridine38-40 synthase
VEHRRIHLELSYNGGAYEGWQIQPYRKTVQGTVEEVLTKLNGNNPIRVTGCGRTDTGVHAQQYFAQFEGGFSELEQLKYKLNKMLPNDILVHAVFYSDLHARFDAKRRTYKYFIGKHKDAFSHSLRWVFERTMNLAAMNDASKFLIGIHDFTSFAKTDTDVKTAMCEVFEIGWEETKHEYIYTVCANRFLRNMVRSMVGTFVDVGLGKIAPDELPKILSKKNRCEASESVPAHGLFLWKVEY